jgi:hypothetical protein
MSHMVYIPELVIYIYKITHFRKVLHNKQLMITKEAAEYTLILK